MASIWIVYRRCVGPGELGSVSGDVTVVMAAMVGEGEVRRGCGWKDMWGRVGARAGRVRLRERARC